MTYFSKSEVNINVYCTLPLDYYVFFLNKKVLKMIHTHFNVRIKNNAIYFNTFLGKLGNFSQLFSYSEIN